MSNIRRLLKSDLSSIGCISLKTTVENGDGTLDKAATSHDDLLDAFRMSTVLALIFNRVSIKRIIRCTFSL